jgi:uncharacterized protein
MSAASRKPDWTTGEERIVYQTCPSCRALWYFRRDFCPRCGHCPPTDCDARGTGTVYAITLVTRAPAEEFRPHVPYAIALIDADEGFRLMAHVDRDLRIGDKVRARFITVAGRLVPYFEKITP